MFSKPNFSRNDRTGRDFTRDKITKHLVRTIRSHAIRTYVEFRWNLDEILFREIERDRNLFSNRIEHEGNLKQFFLKSMEEIKKQS